MFNVSLIVIRKQDPMELRKIQKERVQGIPQQKIINSARKATREEEINNLQNNQGNNLKKYR